MANEIECPDCGEAMDPRGLPGHRRMKQNGEGEEPEQLVRESRDPDEILEKVESDELVGVADNAIVFRSEVIVTDPDIKERIADALVEKMGGGPVAL